jgi:hypothetical protein
VFEGFVIDLPDRVMIGGCFVSNVHFIFSRGDRRSPLSQRLPILRGVRRTPLPNSWGVQQGQG